MRNLFPVIYIVFLYLFTPVNAQEKLNITDKNGSKQGHWIKRDSNGHKIYEGFFRDDHPVGDFRRFYSHDSLQSVLRFSNDGNEAEAVFFHPNGFKASEGKYVSQMKHGTWKFFSANLKDYLITEEKYERNRKEGMAVRYYPDGSVFERINFTNDIRDGEWTQYYPGGKLCLKAYYTNGILNGKFEIYFENGQPQFTGQYLNDTRDGTWLKYGTDGKVKSTINYTDGRVSDPEHYREENDYLDRIEKNKGKIADPEKTGTIWN